MPGQEHEILAPDVRTEIATLRREMQREIALVRTEMAAAQASALNLVVRAALAVNLLVTFVGVAAMWHFAHR